MTKHEKIQNHFYDALYSDGLVHHPQAFRRTGLSQRPRPALAAWRRDSIHCRFNFLRPKEKIYAFGMASVRAGRQRSTPAVRSALCSVEYKKAASAQIKINNRIKKPAFRKTISYAGFCRLPERNDQNEFIAHSLYVLRLCCRFVYYD